MSSVEMKAKNLSDEDVDDMIARTFADAYQEPRRSTSIHLANGDPVWTLTISAERLQIAIKNLRQFVLVGMNHGVELTPELIEVGQWLKERNHDL